MPLFQVRVRESYTVTLDVEAPTGDMAAMMASKGEGTEIHRGWREIDLLDVEEITDEENPDGLQHQP